EDAIATLAQYGSPDDIAILLVPDGEVSPAQENAFQLIAANAGRHAIVGSWGIHNAKTLEVLPNTRQPSLVVSVPWHPATSPNPDFPKHTAQLWGTSAQGQTALTYDATRAMIAALRTQAQPSPTETRNALADPSFSIWGATGKIAFEKSGDRKSPPQVLIQAAQCSSNSPKPTFTPILHPCQSAGHP
ncbi:MAG: serine/threonine protein kinase, partial [Cyanobacteria bacterium P01_A01_bin.17]